MQIIDITNVRELPKDTLFTAYVAQSLEDAIAEHEKNHGAAEVVYRKPPQTIGRWPTVYIRKENE